MKTTIENAITLLTQKSTTERTTIETMQTTQAVLNLAHALVMIANLKDKSND